MRQACSMSKAEACVQEALHAHETGVLDESEARTCLAVGRKFDERRSMGTPTGMLGNKACSDACRYMQTLAGGLGASLHGRGRSFLKRSLQRWMSFSLRWGQRATNTFGYQTLGYHSAITLLSLSYTKHSATTQLCRTCHNYHSAIPNIWLPIACSGAKATPQNYSQLPKHCAFSML